jgi:Protein of unknown function (DUF2778)
VAFGTAAWITGSSQAVSMASAALPGPSDPPSFPERFRGLAPPAMEAERPSLQPLDRSALAAFETKLWDAKARLAQHLMYGDWRAAAIGDTTPSVEEAADEATEEPTPRATVGIPLPRPRPVLASVEPQAGSTTAIQAEATSRGDNRTLFEKLSDLLPGHVTLASLSPDGGLLRSRVNLAAMGYDNQTAVYDISARAVYLPNGLALEAHSGMGRLRDDPDYVDRRMVGATPPAIYELKPREKLFHGVAALRMTPADGNTVFGRSGLLAHSYMLGPEGDSNGCVSIRDYDKFLAAFQNGEVNRLLVVTSLGAAARTTQAQL